MFYVTRLPVGKELSTWKKLRSFLWACWARMSDNLSHFDGSFISHHLLARKTLSKHCASPDLFKMDNAELRVQLNSELKAQGPSEGMVTCQTPAVVSKKKKTVANTAKTEWNIGRGDGENGGKFQEHWPDHLPKPPSQRKMNADGGVNSGNPNLPKVIVFNANTQEGSSLVRVLSEKGLRVVAIVRIVTSRNTKNLMKLPNVELKVGDLNDHESIVQAAQGCQQAFLVTKYWERFENTIEEQIAQVVLNASAEVGIKRLVLTTFENIGELKARGRKSQIVPTPDGLIYPNFDPMNSINTTAKKVGVSLTHMFTSYLDEEGSRKSLVLIRGENGKIISQSGQ